MIQIIDSIVFLIMDQWSKWTVEALCKIILKDVSTMVEGQCGSSREAGMFVRNS